MPPKKTAAAKDEKGGAAGADKGKKVSEEDGEAVILEYFIKQNRPYNATDLQANLKTKHNISKPAVTKALSSLAGKGQLVEKEYGKQKIYGPVQAEVTINAEELVTLKEETESLRAKTKELAEMRKGTAAEMAILESAPTTAELPGKIAGLEKQVNSSATHLASIKANPSMLLSKADIASIDASFLSVRKIWLARRKIGIEVCNYMVDPMNLSKEAAREWLVEEQGIEFDDARLDELAKPQLGKPAVKRKLGA